MSVYRTSLLAFASLLPIALAMPAAAATNNKGNKLERYIGGPVSTERCHWYNFHQSVSLWPVYTACGGKDTQHWREHFHKKDHPNNFSDNAQKMMGKADLTSHTNVYKPGHILIEIDKHYDKQACEVFNYIHSRYRTPLYMKCEHKTHKASYGMYSANDYLKDFTVPKGASNSEKIRLERAWAAKQTGDAPDVVAGLKKITKVTKEINGKHHTMSACEWSNFFQSLTFLPRYVNCAATGADPHLPKYEKFANLNKIKFGFSQGTSHTGVDFFNKDVTLSVGEKNVTAKACVWYNLVQTEVRWPMYKKCSPNDVAPTSPKPDLMVRHKLHYKN